MYDTNFTMQNPTVDIFVEKKQPKEQGSTITVKTLSTNEQVIAAVKLVEQSTQTDITGCELQDHIDQLKIAI